MPKRTNNNSSPISLFSFQDIITAVTGIMILVVLLLILTIIDKKLTEIPNITPTKTDDAERVKLYDSITKIELEIKKKIDHLEKLNSVIKNKTENSRSLSELIKIKKNLKRETRKNQKLISELNKNLTLKKKQLKELNEKHLKVLAVAGKEIENNSRSVEKLESEITKVESELENLKANMHKIIFNMPVNSNKNPIIVECSQDGITINLINDKKIIKFKNNSITFIELIKKFESWLDNRNNRKDYIVLFIKPSSAGYIPLIFANLELKHFEYSKEPFEENQPGIM
jgi:DNA repair exonuclease SbcCD ATPase subunit